MLLGYFTCFITQPISSEDCKCLLYIDLFPVTLSDGLQQVTASVPSWLWLWFGSRAGCPTTTRGRRGSRDVRWWRGARRRWRRRRRWWPATCRHRRRRRRSNGGHRRWRRGSRWGRIGIGGAGERRRGRWGVEARGRRRNPEARGWRRGRRCRGRGKVWARVGWRRGHGGCRRWVGWTQHTGTLLGWRSVPSVIIPMCEGEEVRHVVQQVNSRFIIYFGSAEPCNPQCSCIFHVRSARVGRGGNVLATCVCWQHVEWHAAGYLRHVWGWRRQEVITGWWARVIGIGAGTLLEAFRSESISRSNTAI